MQDGETLGLERTQSATGEEQYVESSTVGLVEMMWLHQSPREVWSLRAPELDQKWKTELLQKS